MGSITNVMSVEVKIVTSRFRPFFRLESSGGVSEESRPISTLSYSRTVQGLQPVCLLCIVTQLVEMLAFFFFFFFFFFYSSRPQSQQGE